MGDLESTNSSAVFVREYILGELLGQGGFGKVYKANHRYIKNKVACIKVVRPDYQNEELNNLLWREATVLDKLRHEHIVHLHTLDIENGQPYLIMDYIDGGDLAAHLKKALGPLSLDEVDTIINQIAQGLNYLHTHQVIHRDLKPQNILRDNNGRIVIADFGLAKIIDSARTQSLQSGLGNAGTPPYMAPEHLAGKPDYRSDLYSLGVIAYQLLTNCLPFGKEGHSHKAPPSLHSLNPKIPDEVERVVLKMLSKAPEDRYQSSITFHRYLHKAIIRSTVKERVNPANIAAYLPQIADGRIVSLDPGEYQGPFTIAKKIHLIGSGTDTKLYTVDEPVLFIKTSGVLLENMVIQRTRESNGEAAIQAIERTSYRLRHVTIQGGLAEDAIWDDTQWLLPLDGIDLGRIPAESMQTRTMPIEVKEHCTVTTNIVGLSAFPHNLLPGSHHLVLAFDAAEQLPGTNLNGFIQLQAETEVKLIAVKGQIEQSTAPFMSQIQVLNVVQKPVHNVVNLPVGNIRKLDENQIQGWEMLLDFQQNLIKKRQFWVEYTKHNYRAGAARVTFSLNMQNARGYEKEQLTSEDAQTRIRAARKEQLSFFSTLPVGMTYRVRSMHIGNLEQFQAEGNVVINLDQSATVKLQRGEETLTSTGYLNFSAQGDMRLIRRQQEALDELKQGKALNPALTDFFFDAHKARSITVTRHLQSADLLSGTCNRGQIEAIEMALAAPDLLLIQGPPGTGKTTVIAEICYQVAQSGGRTLIASQSNLAVDNALGRLLHNPSIRALRKGNVGFVEDEGRDFVEERVVETWINNTANDCQTKAKQRKKHIALFKPLVKAAPHFSRYYKAEIQWDKEQIALQRKIAQIQDAKSKLQDGCLQSAKDIREYVSRRQTFAALLALTFDEGKDGYDAALDDVFQYLKEAGNRKQFVRNLNTCLQILKEVNLAPIRIGQLMQNTIWLKKIVPVYVQAWKENKYLLTQIEEAIAERAKIERQKQDDDAALERKKAQVSSYSTQIASLTSEMQQYSTTVDGTLKSAAKMLPESAYFEATLQAFINTAIQRRRANNGPFKFLMQEMLPQKFVVAVQKSKSATGLLAYWQVTENALQIHLLKVVEDIDKYEQTRSTLAACSQQLSQEWMYLPEIHQTVEQLLTNQQPHILQDSVNVTLLMEEIKININVITSTRKKMSGLLGQFFKEQNTQNLIALFVETRNRLNTADESLKYICQYIQRANERVAKDIAQELIPRLQKWLQAQKEEAINACKQINNKKKYIEREMEQIQDDLRKDEIRISSIEKLLVTHTHTVVNALRNLGDNAAFPTTLIQPVQQNNVAFLSFIERYQTRVQHWEGEVRLLETLTGQLWQELENVKDTIQEPLAHARTALAQQQQRLHTLVNEQAQTAIQIAQIPTALQTEREWWQSFLHSIEGKIRPQAPAEDIFSLPFLETAQQQFAAWEQELTKEVAFSQRYNPLINDWVHELKNIAEPEKMRLQEVYLKNANVIGITCGQAPRLSFEALSAFSTFDVVIIDEVSKATPPELLLPALKGRKLILIGDHHQLPPMIEDKTLDQMAQENGQDATAFRYLNDKPYFAERYKEAANDIKCMLSTQYRMHPDIMAVINQFYEHPLECGLLQPDIERDHKLASPLVGEKKHLIWMTTPQVSILRQDSQKISVRNKTSRCDVFTYQSMYKGFEEERSGTSYVNRREVEVIKRVCEELQQTWAKKMADNPGEIEPKEIGIITFYAAQHNLLKSSLGITERGKSSLFGALNIRVGTVDRFQGMERAVIIVSMVRNNTRGEIGFAERDERINVAFSRAQELLLIVGCHDLFCNTTHKGTAGERYSNVSKIVKHRGDIIDISCI